MAKRSGSVAALAFVLALLVAAPGEATFPGRNGEIVLIEGSGGKYGGDGLYELLRFKPRLGDPVRRDVCGQGSVPVPFSCDLLIGPAVSPDGSRLAAFQYEGPTVFFPETGPETFSLWTLDRDGRRIESRPVQTIYSGPRWAPDASALVAERNYYPSDDVGAPVVVLGTDGSEHALVAEHASRPDWCSDGRIILVKYGEIRVVEADGSLRRLTWRGGTEPSCSPDGRRVAFTRDGAIWTIALAGGRARRLAKGYRPVWSPDGRQIAFLRDDPIVNDGVAETFLHRLGLRRLRVRQVSKSHIATDDPYTNERIMGLDWQALPAASGVRR
jgi:Tol biopolymer transport system component